LKNKDVKRVFIGIPAGHQIQSILPLIKSADNYKSSFIKWMPIENIHLTLSFLGDISNKNIPDLIQSVENKISTSQFQLRISGAGIFPLSKSPKVLWLGLDCGVDKLKILYHQIENSVSKFKAKYEKITFIPHITIARIKHGSLKIDVLPFLNSVYSTIDLEVNSVSMYESKLYPEGAQYTVLKTFPLN